MVPFSNTDLLHTSAPSAQPFWWSSLTSHSLCHSITRVTPWKSTGARVPSILRIHQKCLPGPFWHLPVGVIPSASTIRITCTPLQRLCKRIGHPVRGPSLSTLPSGPVQTCPTIDIWSFSNPAPELWPLQHLPTASPWWSRTLQASL